MFLNINCIHASSIEKLIMPGKLIAGHEELEEDCGQCHKLAGDTPQKKLCLDCHDDVRIDLEKKVGFHGKSKRVSLEECRVCHTDHKGRSANIVVLDESVFNHNETNFELIGKHQQVVCAECHKTQGKYRDAKNECVACHDDDDVHKGELGSECENCHSEKAWTSTRFDHSDTQFPLLGAHKDVVCSLCHKDEHYEKTPKACVDCHRIDDTHLGSHGEKCETCHTEEKWDFILFDHNKDTKFSLTGQHKKAQCQSCHTRTIYKPKLEKKCISCHKRDDTHKGRNGEKCAECHNSDSWSKTTFDHDEDTKFALHGALRCYVEAISNIQ